MNKFAHFEVEFSEWLVLAVYFLVLRLCVVSLALSALT